MTSFGALLRFHRRQCRDPNRGGLLTQDRLGELLGDALGHAGYSGAAVSDWERNKSKIDEDDRLVLVALISVLYRCQGLRTVQEANELLHAGNYRAMDGGEQATVFPDAVESARAGSESTPDVPPPQPGPPISASTPERQKLRILLDKVQRFWIDGVLRKTLTGSMSLEIAWERSHGDVEHPWDTLVDPALYGASGGLSLAGEFDYTDRALLILGQAGSGKTTTLLKLARLLGSRAEIDPTAPVPIVLNLSSWAADRHPLADWVTEELIAKYQIPGEIGRGWLEDDALILLLDGFDEVPDAQRPRCAQAINRFRRERGLTGIVVCSRPTEYEGSGVRLRLGGSIRLRPLTDTQRDAFLEAAGEKLAGLRLAIRCDDTLQELARSPLFLDIMSVVFQNETAAAVASLATGPRETAGEMEVARGRLFSAYTKRMFQLHGPQADFSEERTARWLSWLATRMDEHDQPIFLLEDIQPSWLSRCDRRLYLLLGHAIIGLVGGLVMWLLLLGLREIILGFPVVLAPALAGGLGITLGYAEPLALLGGSLALGLVVALIHLRQFERTTIDRNASGKRLLRRRAALVGTVVGLLTTAVVAIFGQLALALSWGLAMGIMYAMVSRYLFGSGYRRDIRSVEALGWSWAEAGRGLLAGVVLALAAEFLETLLFTFNGVARSLLTFGTAGFLIGGLRGKRIEEKSTLNQGIRLSLRSALRGALLAALALGGLTWLLRTPAAAAITAALAALIVFPFFGGVAVPKHYLVRLFLWRQRKMPRDYGRFLAHSVQFGLMRRVGGGYTFIHPLLRSYFAAQAPTETAAKAGRAVGAAS